MICAQSYNILQKISIIGEFFQDMLLWTRKNPTIICRDRSIISGIVFTVSEIFFIFSKMFFTIL